jgi:hypothetical protein
METVPNLIEAAHSRKRSRHEQLFVVVRLAEKRGLILLIAFAGELSMTANLVSGRTRHEIAPERTLHIRLYDRAQTPAETLQWATAETSRIFQDGGNKARLGAAVGRIVRSLWS